MDSFETYSIHPLRKQHNLSLEFHDEDFQDVIVNTQHMQRGRWSTPNELSKGENINQWFRRSMAIGRNKKKKMSF